jgi:acyl carrier protein
MTELTVKVVEILATMAGLPPDQVTPDTTFESLSLDSLDLVELTLMLEDELGVEIDRDDFGELVTVQDAVDAIASTDALAA